MLTSIRVENFKVFQDTSGVSIAPITLLAGINSAGKSSLIQALLLLKQTLESGSSQALSLEGPFLSLGDFNDFLFGHPELEESTLTYHLTSAFTKDDDEELFDALKTLLLSPGTDIARQSLLSEIVVTFGWGPFGHRGRPTVRVANLQITISLKQGSLQRPVLGLDIRPTSGGAYGVQPLLDMTDPSQEDLAFYQLQIDGLSGFLPDSFIIYSEQQQLLFGRDIPLSFARFFRRLFASVRQDLSENILYISSFREPPLRLYSSGQAIGRVVNPQGSNFAQVLWRFRKEPVRFVHPGIPEELPLSNMVMRVLSDVLHLKQRVRVQQVGEREDIVEVKVDTLGPRPFQVTLADVGLGYNQALPIVVQGLLTPPGALVVFEQPEIHLHPDVQARLTDFFFGLAQAGRRVLVETHSSHMVDSLCLAIAKNRNNWLAENIAVLFVHPPDDEHPSARIEPVRIDSYGQILNWPPSFLPDTAAIYEEILKEGFAKRRQGSE